MACAKLAVIWVINPIIVLCNKPNLEFDLFFGPLLQEQPN